MRMVTTVMLLLALDAGAAAAQARDANREGEALYAARCATCHERGVARAANRESLNRLAPELIRQTLTTGSMREQSAGLTPAQVDSLASWLGSAAPARTADNACTASAATFGDPTSGPRWNGWGAGPAQHRFQPA